MTGTASTPISRDPEQNSATSLSLLARLKDDVQKHQAWHDFAARYGPRIEGWSKRWGLQDADARDVAQNVLLQLARQMETFEYDHNGRFRAWLKTITRRAWIDYLKSRSRDPATPGDVDLLQRLDTVEARDDLMAQLDAEADRELLDVAMGNLSRRVKPNVFEAFRLMAFEQLSGAETARRLSMKAGAVFVAKARLDRLLTAEVARLERIAEGS